MRVGWLDIITSKRDDVRYTVVTAYLPTRVHQHRTDPGAAFCRRYGLKMLVLAEWNDTILREKRVKAWKREWKVALIEAANPDWSDLFARIA